MPTTNKRIIIDIPHSGTAHVYDAETGFLQHETLEQLVELTRQTCAHITREFADRLADDDSGIKPYARFHDTILIDGDRGSGKTSFLLTAINRLCAKQHNDWRDKQINEKIGEYWLHSLGVIDPTLVTTRNNFFILVISRIKNAVEQERNRRHDGIQSDLEYRTWQSALRSLASGLSMLDRVGVEPLGKDEWGDAQYILQKGLSDAEGGLALEFRFHKFVNCSLNYIKHNAFVLGFDDIDTDFEKGVEVMQMLRKYLTTPQLIIFMTANYSMLYDMLFQHYRKFFKDNLFKGFKEKDQITQEMKQFVSQYFKKIFPAHRRLTLKIQSELQNDLYIKIPDKLRVRVNNKTEVSFKHFYYSIVSMWYRFPHEICRAIGEFFFSLPIRNIIILLQSIMKNEYVFVALLKCAALKDDQEDLQDAVKFDSIVKYMVETNTYDDKNFYYVMSQIIFVFKEELISLGYSIDDLKNEFELKLYKIANYLYHNKLFETCASLSPSHLKQESDHQLFAFYPLLYMGLVKNIENIFKYYIRVLMLHDAVSHMGYENAHAKKLVDDFYGEQTSCTELCDNFVIESIRSGYYTHDPFLKCVILEDNHKYKFSTKYIKNIICIRITNGDQSPKDYISVYHIFNFLLLLFETHGDINFMTEQYKYLREFNYKIENNGRYKIDIHNSLNTNLDNTDTDKNATEQPDNIFKNIESIIGDYSIYNLKFIASCPYYILYDVYINLIETLKNFNHQDNKWYDVFIGILQIFISKLSDAEKNFRSSLDFKDTAKQKTACDILCNIIEELCSERQ